MNNFDETVFVKQLTNLAPGWVDAINKYGLMYEVFSTFLNDFGYVQTMSDEEFLQRVNSAMLEWDI